MMLFMKVVLMHDFYLSLADDFDDIDVIFGYHYFVS